MGWFEEDSVEEQKRYLNADIAISIRYLLEQIDMCNKQYVVFGVKENSTEGIMPCVVCNLNELHNNIAKLRLCRYKHIWVYNKHTNCISEAIGKQFRKID